MARRRETFLFLVLLGLLSLAGLIAQAARNAGDADGASFFEKAASLSLLQVRMGTVAARRASAADVKAFGAKMVTEFTAIGEEIGRLSPQSVPAKLSDADESTVGYLGTLPGAALDREYTSIALDELARLATVFRTLNQISPDARVKEFATRVLSQAEGYTREGEKVLDGLPKPVLK